MKKINLFSNFIITVGVAVVLTSGCSTSSESKPAPASSEAPSASAAPSAPAAATVPTALEGLWKGHDTTPGQEGPATLKFTGQNVEFHGATDDDWLKGTFTLREDVSPKQWIGLITDCASADAIGKKCYAIYKMEDGILTIAGNQIGTTEFPTTFDASGARQFVFKHEQ